MSRPDRRGSGSAVAIAALGLAVLVGVIAVLSGGCGVGGAQAGSLPRVIVLGIDGMDHALAARLIEEGRLPNLARLARDGGFSPLGTSVPPLSPVAWSDFITGMDSGGHGIFDFIHRDPATMIPYLSTSKAETAEPLLKLGRYQIPGSGEVKLLRHGRAFWELLEENGVETTIIRMPANFPPSGTASRELSGMGTPDVLGTYGTFSFYTSVLFAFAGQEIGGGEVYEVDAFDNVVKASLYGPDNPYLVKEEKLAAEFTAYIDPEDPVVKLVLGDEVRVLEVGEWSGWVPFEFELTPLQSLPAMARFYLRSVRPEFELYASPINFDPMAPAMPISTPASYAEELAEATGRFYTQGMPEDTKALSEGVMTPEEFLAQARLAGEELVEQYDYVLDRFQAGLLFYYLGNIDQVSHMMWRAMDPEHPAYDPETDARFRDVIPELYEVADRMIGRTLERMPPGTLLIVMSDHGFTSWKRSFHLNRWLEEQGFLTVKDPARRQAEFLTNIDWSRTQAYGLGLNGLYLNLEGRERWGSVGPGEREQVLDRIARGLLELIDPATGRPAVTRVYRRDDWFADAGYRDLGPDLVVGCAKGTRISNESATGGVPGQLFSDNDEPWSGDHGMDHETVPGVLFTSQPLKKPAPSLKELAAAILAEFGIEGFPAAAAG